MNNLSSHPESDKGLAPHTKKVVFALIFGALLPLLDTSVVNVAVRPLSLDFGESIAKVQWIITAYALASALAIPVSGYMTRRFGATMMWRIAITSFTLASAFCAASWSIESLIAFRSLQGFAAGLSMPVMQTILISSAGKSQATRAMTAVGLPAVIAPVLGPLLGGLLLDNVGWRWIFILNVPIGIIAFILSLRFLPSPVGNKAARFDIFGFLLLSPALIALVYGIGESDTDSIAMTTSLLLLAAALLAIYVWRSLRSREPLIDIRIFSYATLDSAWITLVLSSMIFYAGLFLIPLYYQEVRAYTALQAGLALGVLGIGAYLSRRLSGILITRAGTRKTVYFFIACTVIGTLPFALPSGNLGLEWVGLLVRGGGIGALTMLSMSALYHQMPAEHIVHVSASSRIATQLGSAIGVALCSLLLKMTTGINHTTFLWLSIITCALLLTALKFPAGKVIRK